MQCFSNITPPFCYSRYCFLTFCNDALIHVTLHVRLIFLRNCSVAQCNSTEIALHSLGKKGPELMTWPTSADVASATYMWDPQLWTICDDLAMMMSALLTWQWWRQQVGPSADVAMMTSASGTICCQLVGPSINVAVMISASGPIC